MRPRGLDDELRRLEVEVERHPGDPRRLVELARALERGGRRTEAFQRITLAEDRAPDPRQRLYLDACLREADYRDQLEPVALPAPDLAPRKRRAITALAFDLGETRLACGVASGELHLYPLGQDLGRATPVYLGEVPSGVNALAWSLEGRVLVTGGGERVVRAWYPDEARVEKLSEALPRRLTSVAVRGPRVGAAWGLGSWWRDARGRARRGRGGLHGWIGRRQLEAGDPDAGAEAALSVQAELFAGSSGPGRDAQMVADPTGRHLGWIRPGAYMGVDLETGERLRVAAPELVARRGAYYDQAPALALRGCGRALAMGSTGRLFHRDPELGGWPQGAHLLLLDDPRRVWFVAARHRVSAVAFSPSGRLLALGTVDGRVLVAELLSLPAAPAPRVAPVVGASLPDEAPEVAVVETRRTRLPTLEDFGLLRRYGGRTRDDRFSHVGDSCLWFRGRQLVLGAGWIGPAASRQWLRTLDLESGEFFEAWVEDAGVEVLPDPPRRTVRGRAALEAELGVKVRAWIHPPRGRLVAMRASKCPQEFWLVDGRDASRWRRFEVNAPLAHLAWTPRGTRLAAVLKDGTVWVFGGRRSTGPASQRRG